MLTHHADIRAPAKSTIHAVLDRRGLVKHKRRRGPKAQGTPLSMTDVPNELWCTDYKGEFMLGDRRYCYPLTVTDFSSRFLLCCEGLESTREALAFTTFERLFREFGLPARIRSDNGVPFSSAHALHGLSRLSVWWLRLGIEIERIKPGNPQQNGRHERMHRTLKQATTRPPGSNMLQQQDKFEDFIREYNYERPHGGLRMKTPAQCHRASERAYKGLPDFEYDFHDKTVVTTECARLRMDRKKIHISTVLARQSVGIRQVDDQIWQLSFMEYDLGYFNLENGRFDLRPNPFGLSVLTM